MDNLTFLAIFAVIILAAAGTILFRMLRTIRLESKQVRRVRTTDLYGHLYPMLKHYDSEYVESVRIRPDSISIRMVIPLGKEVHYTFVRHGLDKPSPDTLYALAQAISVDMKVLRSSGNYMFRSHTEKNAAGQTVRWYEYLIRSRRKSELLRIDQKRRRNGNSTIEAENGH